MSLICDCKSKITSHAVSIGFAAPIRAAFSANAFKISLEIVIGLNISLLIELISTLEIPPNASLIPSSDIFINLAASMSSFKVFFTLNNARLAFRYASTTSLPSIGPPFKVTLVNKDLESLAPSL